MRTGSARTPPARSRWQAAGRAARNSRVTRRSWTRSGRRSRRRSAPRRRPPRCGRSRAGRRSGARDGVSPAAPLSPAGPQPRLGQRNAPGHVSGPRTMQGGPPLCLRSGADPGAREAAIAGATSPPPGRSATPCSPPRPSDARRPAPSIPPPPRLGRQPARRTRRAGALLSRARHVLMAARLLPDCGPGAVAGAGGAARPAAAARRRPLSRSGPGIAASSGSSAGAPPAPATAPSPAAGQQPRRHQHVAETVIAAHQHVAPVGRDAVPDAAEVVWKARVVARRGSAGGEHGSLTAQAAAKLPRRIAASQRARGSGARSASKGGPPAWFAVPKRGRARYVARARLRAGGR